jgi:hypothetical protein
MYKHMAICCWTIRPQQASRLCHHQIVVIRQKGGFGAGTKRLAGLVALAFPERLPQWRT